MILQRAVLRVVAVEGQPAEQGELGFQVTLGLAISLSPFGVCAAFARIHPDASQKEESDNSPQTV
ncbi:MAG TPA: hypothetical protein VF717_09505 [Pyrinomonadaceae bacterium]